MIDTIESSRFGKRLTIGDEFNRGGHGLIWKTNDPRLLLKQFEPSLISDDPGQQDILRRKAQRAYTAFSAAWKGNQPELRALPGEYLTYRGNPSYLMQKVDGQLLQTLFRQNAILSETKVALSYAVARAMRKLHDAKIVHADANPENLLVAQSITGFTVVVLDIDAGGLSSKSCVGPVYPMGQPKRLYKAPELAAMGWADLFKRSLFFAPDEYALSVLLYQLLVDYQGPFCSVRTHPNPAVTNYRPFEPTAYRDPGVSWPMPWQERLLARSMLSPKVASLFYETFQDRFSLHRRPTASQWEEALCPTPAPPPVRHVYAIANASISVTRASPRPLTDPIAVPQKPDAILHAGQEAFGWREAMAGIVRKLHLKRGVSGNEGGLTNAA